MKKRLYIELMEAEIARLKAELVLKHNQIVKLQASLDPTRAATRELMRKNEEKMFGLETIDWIHEGDK